MHDFLKNHHQIAPFAFLDWEIDCYVPFIHLHKGL